MSDQDLLKIAEMEKQKAYLESLEAISFDEYSAAIHKWMLISDMGIVKLLPAIYVANLLDRDPVWMMVIGPSGGGKTEIMNSLLDLKMVYPISLVTPHTFLSGFPGKGDTSLLPKVTGKTLLFKDWTSILSLNKEAGNEIMGQLREIFDGHLKKPFGNGRIAEWSGKIGIIAGVTPAIDIAQQMHASLGERFIHYRINMPDRMEVARRCLANNENVKLMRKEMSGAMYSFIKGIDIDGNVPDLPKDATEEILRVANLATLARSGIIRDFGPRKEVVYVPSPEMPTRIVQQLATIASALMMVGGGKFDPVLDMNILTKIAMDSIPQTNRMVMEALASWDYQTTADLAVKLGYPTAPIHTYLENLALLGVCRRIRGKDTAEEYGSSDRWSLRTDFVEIVMKANADSAAYRPPEVSVEEETVKIEDVNI